MGAAQGWPVGGHVRSLERTLLYVSLAAPIADDFLSFQVITRPAGGIVADVLYKYVGAKRGVHVKKCALYSFVAQNPR